MKQRPTTDQGSDSQSAPGMPRWVKVFAIIAVVLTLVIAVLLLSGGKHGPGRHFSSSQVGVHMPL